MDDDDRAGADERLAEVDADVYEKINGATSSGKSGGKGIEDGSDDEDHDDSKMPVGKTIVAENQILLELKEVIVTSSTIRTLPNNKVLYEQK